MFIEWCKNKLIMEFNEELAGMSDDELLAAYDEIRGTVSYYHAGWDFYNMRPEQREKENRELKVAHAKMERMHKEILRRNLTPNPGNFLVGTEFNKGPQG
jgi:hypothetical protein